MSQEICPVHPIQPILTTGSWIQQVLSELSSSDKQTAILPVNHESGFSNMFIWSLYITYIYRREWVIIVLRIWFKWKIVKEETHKNTVRPNEENPAQQWFWLFTCSAHLIQLWAVFVHLDESGLMQVKRFKRVWGLPDQCVELGDCNSTANMLTAWPENLKLAVSLSETD